MRRSVLSILAVLLVLALGLSACAPTSAPATAPQEAAPQAPEAAQGAEPAAEMGELVPQIVVLSNVQAADPIEFESTRLVVENMKQLGLDVEHRAMPWEQQADLVWYNRTEWQMTAWRMVGRPERLDPDEFVVNLFHSSTAEKGYNFVGFQNERYDQVALAQRATTDREERRQLIWEAQEIIANEVPYAFVAYPQLPYAYRSDVWNPDTIVDAKGIGIKNFWTFVQAEPMGGQADFVLNTGDVVQAINPLFISGAADSWITELIWDRLMRVGPDGLPQPWAAESVEWEDNTNVLVTLREGMRWHDGQPVTVEDVIFSFQAPATDEAPMYKPFVNKIAQIEKVDDRTVRFTLSEPWAAFEVASLAKINLIPKHIWEPILADLATKEENAESYQEEVPIGSGPYRFVAFKPSEEVILEANPEHFAAPKASRWILRIIPNVESALGQLRNGEINFLSEWEGDPTVLQGVADGDPDIELVATTEVGFRFFAMNNRVAPFDDTAFRQAVAYVVPKQAIVQNIFKGFAVPADSHVSVALEFWHHPELPQYDFSIEKAREVLAQAGYTWDEEGRLRYPAGQ